MVVFVAKRTNQKLVTGSVNRVDKKDLLFKAVLPRGEKIHFECQEVANARFSEKVAV